MIGRVRYWRDLERWVPGGLAALDVAFPLVPVGELLRPRREAVSVKEFSGCEPITIHFDGSIDRRDRTRPFKGAMFAAHPGDVIFSKIDVRNGAIAIIPPSFKKVVVTSEYPIHVPDTKQVDPRYLALLLRSPNFLHLLKSAASGTSGRKRVDADNFGGLEIPLPDPPEQTALLDAYEKARNAADVLEAEAKRTEHHGIQEFESALGLTPPPDLPRRLLQIAYFRQIEKWSHEGILHRSLVGDALPESHFDIVLLEEVARVTYGLQKCPTNRPGRNARPYLRVANVQQGRLDLRVIKFINVSDKEMTGLRLEVGDILLCEGNSADLVGRGAIWNGEIPECVHQNHVLKVRVLDKRRVLPEFILEYINCSQGQAYFRSKAKRTTNLASINSTEVAQMPLPLPSTVDEQAHLLKGLRAARKSAASLRQEANRIKAAAWNDFLGAVFH